VTAYSWFNTVFLLTVGLALVLARPALPRRRTILRVSIVIPALGYPWDFFAIRLECWTYSDPGPLLFGVPVNDLVFIWCASMLTTLVLTSPALLLAEALPRTTARSPAKWPEPRSRPGSSVATGGEAPPRAPGARES